MPRLRTPPAMPQEVERVIELLGSRVRAGILRELAHGERTAGELALAAGTSLVSVSRHLAALERAGMVATDAPAGQRKGRQDLRWRAEPHAVAAALKLFADYVSGK